METRAVKIDACDLKEDFRPLLVRFTNGKLVPGEDSMKYRLYNNVTGNKDNSKRKILVSETDRLSYMGRNFNPDLQQQPAFKYLLGILDKNTGKMRLCDADMFHMLPVIKNDTDSASKPRNSIQKNRDDLTAAFGSSMKRKAMEARVKNKIETGTFDKLADVALNDTNDTHQSSFSELKMTATGSGLAHLADILPPMNREASSVTDVFLVDNMLTDFEWKAIEDIAVKVSKNIEGYVEEWREQRCPQISVNGLLIAKRLGESGRIQAIKLLLYVNYLTSILHFSHKDKEKRDPFSKDIPLSIRKRLLKDFTAPSTGKQKVLIDSRMQDKVRLHVMALALVIYDFEVETAILQKDLKIEPAKIKSLFVLLGVNVGKVKGTKEEMARLSLPLMPLPERSRQRKSVRL